MFKKTILNENNIQLRNFVYLILSLDDLFGCTICKSQTNYNNETIYIKYDWYVLFKKI